MSYQSSVLADSPFAYWTLDSSGGGLTDLVAGRTLTPVGAPGPAAYKDPTGITPFDLNGSSQLFKILDAALMTGEAQTIEAIVFNRRASISGFAAMEIVAAKISRSGSPYYCHGIYLGLNEAQTFDSATYAAATSMLGVDIAGLAPARFSGAWVHVAAVFSGANLTLWVSGQTRKKVVQNPSNPIPSDSPIVIGGRDDFVQLLDGSVTHVALYNKALTDDQLRAHAEEAGLVIKRIGVRAISEARTRAQTGSPQFSAGRLVLPCRANATKTGFCTGPGMITSTVKVRGTSDVPAQRQVGLYSCRSRQLVQATWSDPVTGVYAFSGVATDEPFFVVSWDHTGVFDAVVHDRIFASLP